MHHALAGASRRIPACLLAVAITALVTSVPAHAAGCRFANAAPGTATAAQVSQATLCLLNQQRTGAGLKPLNPSAPLATAASTYAAYMVSTDHFAHTDANGHDVVYRVLQTDPALANRWQVFGENLGWGSYSMATPSAMVQGWMNSPPHRANILYPGYDQIGVGTARGAPTPGNQDALTYATVFGKIKPAPVSKRTARHARKAGKHRRKARAKHRRR